jgi:hypothetical protein
VEDLISYSILVLVIFIRYGYIYLAIKYIQRQINKSNKSLETIMDPIGSNKHAAKHSMWIAEHLTYAIPIITLLYFVIDFIIISVSSFLTLYLI